MTDEQVMKMCLRRFWVMEKNVTRIQAERDFRLLRVNSMGQSKEGLDELTKQLTFELGTTVVAEPELDREGLNKFKGKTFTAG